MRLYSFAHSPNPLKVRIALAELGAAHDTVEVNLFRGEHRAESYRAVNPHAKVPVLEDGELRVRESNAILAYLGKRLGGALWPTDTAAEARALQWLFFEAFLQTCFGSLWWTDRVSRAIGRPGADDAIVKEDTEELERALAVLEGELTHDWLLGSFSLVDCSLGVAISMLRETRLDDGRFPKSFAYASRLRARPSWQAAGGDGIYRFG